jgi:hypothetical protein
VSATLECQILHPPQWNSALNFLEIGWNFPVQSFQACWHFQKVSEDQQKLQNLDLQGLKIKFNLKKKKFIVIEGLTSMSKMNNLCRIQDLGEGEQQSRVCHAILVRNFPINQWFGVTQKPAAVKQDSMHFTHHLRKHKITYNLISLTQIT